MGVFLTYYNGGSRPKWMANTSQAPLLLQGFLWEEAAKHSQTFEGQHYLDLVYLVYLRKQPTGLFKRSKYQIGHWKFKL
jgi:hypothetical protein